MIRIEVLVSAVAIALFLLAIFGARRRRSRNWFIQKGAFGAYTLSFSVATYIIGSMQSSVLKSSMYPIWAVCLFFIHGCTDSITAYSLEDNTQRTKLVYEAYMYFAYGLLLFSSVPTVYAAPLVFIAFFRYAQRLAAWDLASCSWNWNKIVADYMYEEKNNGVFADMEGCNYLVDWPISKSMFKGPIYATQLSADPKKDVVIGIGNIWQCKDIALVQELKDDCLSFSLFHLLRTRCFRFACDESKDGANNFVLKVLLPGDKDSTTGYKRAFKLIEVELAFMYDFFFTKYAAIYYGPIAATVWSLISVIGVSITAYITARVPVNIYKGDSTVAGTVTDDVVITLVILSCIALLEFIQLLIYWTGIWGRVSFVCQSIREKARLDNRRKARQGKETRTRESYCIMGFKRLLARIGVWLSSNKHYWQHRLGQYSLLDSVSYKPSSSVVIRYLLGSRLMATMMKTVYLLDHKFSYPSDHQASRVRGNALEYVELTDEVKEAVIGSLKFNEGQLSNGRSSLKTN